MNTEASIIVIPLHHGGGKLKTDFELRFTLRSLEKNFTDPFRVVIVGKKMPDWIQNVDFIRVSSKGLKHALNVSASRYPSGFFWHYDDCVLLKKTSSSEMKRTPSSKKWGRSTGTKWGKMLTQVYNRLKESGLSTFDYSRPHGPYFYDKSMIDESFEDWPGMKGKFPFESWILNKRDHPRIHGAVIQFYGAFNKRPRANHRHLNYNDRGNSLELRNWLRSEFPQMSGFEKSDEISKKDKYHLQSRHIHNAWKNYGSPALRTICECAVGPHSLLCRFEGKADRAVFIEPDPDQARAATFTYPWAEVMPIAVMMEHGTVNLKKMSGSSFIGSIPWSPAIKSNPKGVAKAKEISVVAVPFNLIDDGMIDIINIDCEGAEWFVLANMRSRPFLIQIELYKDNAHFDDITKWISDNEYEEVARWGNANFIYLRSSK